VIRLLTVSLSLFTCALQAQPLAWRASNPDSNGELLLLGSIHVLREQDYPLPPLIDELYAQADIVVMELELDEIDPLAMQTQLVSAALIANGGRLRSVLDPDLYALADQEASELGIDLELFDQFEPWFVALTLSSLGIMRLGYQQEIGLEQYLLARAREDGKDVLGLELLEDQVAVFDNLSDREQAAMLEQTLQELRTSEAAMRELINAWKTGQLTDLSDQLVDDFGEFPQLYEQLVSNRNANWANSLATLIDQQQRALVVVGALHLVGDGNVIDLLTARGFEITALD